MRKFKMTNSFIEDINLNDFKVIPSDAFAAELLPVMTLYYEAVSFSNEAHRALNNCDNIQLLINVEKKQIVIKPSSSKEDDILCWKTCTKNTNFKKYKCFNIVSQLFSSWNYNPDLKYKANGKLVQAERKVMLLFDFTRAESYERTKKIK